MRTDAELLSSSDPGAFREFYERHVTAVAAYLGRRTRHPDVVFDLLAETFARAYEHRRQQDPRKGPAIAWLLSTARYVLADAERRGQVPDAARTRLQLGPFALDGAALAAVGERSRTDLAEALKALPESQRIAVYRRVLGDDEYQPAPAAISVSAQLKGEEPRRARDPFDELGERFFLAAGGRLPRSRRRTVVLLTAAVLLFGVGVAAAAIRVFGDDDERQRPRPTATPTPTPTPTTPADPLPPVPPTATPRAPRAQPGPGGTAPMPTQPPVQPPLSTDIDLTPDLRAGRVGWCIRLTEQTLGGATVTTGCSPAGPPGTMLIAAGGATSKGYAIVDRAVRELRLSDGRVITPDRDRGLPTRWRAATWDIVGAAPRYTLHDVTGRELPARTGAPPAQLDADRVPASDPPSRRCAIRTREGSRLRATSARLVPSVAPLDMLRPSFLSCASTTYRLNGRRMLAAVLLDAADPDRTAPRIPSTGEPLTARREGPGWLVVYGGSERQRERALRDLRVTGP
ncbi:RNA polymerase sigma factor [Solirubrobacter sp. CPCC 204708]|uniref:RNA polymerase sigma factor n=1 Tax=Solirubrobacter deserti TaxID=2282478 RepID=A0ABT4RDG8_9ACTN|nr:RNA polymerase sigma factor [Solirubrobacter deserti]MBE2314582.1 RNA polymerase sigma factor [Solirubrobacter deserti]MDA0136586.1 RNA polymerase sigma factor [Solirubrobacter deserti]